jgi:hypothetical protein
MFKQIKNTNIINTLLALLLFLLTNSINAQNKQYGVSLSNNVTSFPVTGYTQLFYSQFHPGLDAFKGWKINKSEKNQLEVKANAGFYYHRFVQTAIRIYPSLSFYKTLCKRFSLGAGIGGGYAMSFEGSEVFKLNSEGKYEPKKKINGRSQFLINFEIGGQYHLKKDNPNGARIFLALKTFIQGPFVSGYVPLLPVNSLFLGVLIPVKSNKE